MSCVCETYLCLEAYFNPCSTGVQVNVVANETGTWQGTIFFNGMPTILEFGVTNGDKIVLPTQFLNEDYTHELRLFNSGGTLVNCYHLESKAATNAGEFTPISPTGNFLDGDVFEGNGTDTQTFVGIGEVIEITIGFQVYTPDSFVQVEVDGELTEQIIMNDGVTFYGTIVIKWKNS